jgi:hypothetical protein
MDEACSGSWLDYIPLQPEFGFFPRQKVRRLGSLEPNPLLPPCAQRRPTILAERRRALCGTGGAEDIFVVLELS